MARMLPSRGPQSTSSFVTEPDIYWRLAKQLDDSFTVIHSLPWLNAAVKTLDLTYAPTGEIDFVVLHPILGILVLEAKGGVFKFDRTKFTYTRTNEVFDPIGQMRRGVFTLSEWLKTKGIRIPIGYAWIFPNVDTSGKQVPIAMEDPSFPDGRPIIDHRHMPELGGKVKEIMQYWKKTLGNRNLSISEIDNLVDLICPVAEYDLGWDARIDYDNRTWLTFNEQQARNLRNIIEEKRTVVSGRPGTGKTVLAVALARYLAADGKKVLFVLHNKHITTKVRKELSDTQNVYVESFLALCFRAAKMIGVHIKEDLDRDDFDTAHEHLAKAIRLNRMEQYDAVIVDEGQIIHREWYETLRMWISRIHVFCDETQAFPFEKRLTTDQLVEEVIDAEYAGILTVNMRSPKLVFERIDLSLPSIPYEQFSPRQSETDTLQELASVDPLSTLWGLLKNELKNIPSQNIAIVTSKERIKELQSLGALEKLSTKVDLIDTSERVRGLEYPIIIAYDIDFSKENLLIINAYARATTKVIGIYSIWRLRLYEKPEIEKEPFIIELFKNPEIAEAVRSPWTYILKNIGWELTPIVTHSASLFWNHNLGAWIVKTETSTNKLEDEMWICHLLMNDEHPIYQVTTIYSFLSIGELKVEAKELDSSVTLSSVRIATCSNCNNLAIQDKDGVVLCVFCNPTTYPIPPRARLLTQYDKIVTSPDMFSPEEKIDMGLHLLSLCALQKMDIQLADTVRKYAASAGNKIGYQPLLVLTGALISRSSAEQVISLDGISTRLKEWIKQKDHKAMENILPYATNTWQRRGWIYKPSKERRGFYLRARELPLYDSTEVKEN